jgi:hypothetical protein
LNDSSVSEFQINNQRAVGAAKNGVGSNMEIRNIGTENTLYLKFMNSGN